MTARKFLLLILILLPQSPVFAMGEDDPLLASLNVGELEWREDDVLVWDADAWIGKDRDKLWFKSQGERSDGTTDEFETELFYHRAISPYWNLRTGWRGDWQPETRRSWFALGLAGLAPGFIDTELTAYIADGRSAAYLDVSYELNLTQRLTLEPEFEANWYSDDDPANGRGDGFTDLEITLRLYYQVRPELAPYVGISYTALYGDTGDIAEAEGDRDRDLQVLAGLSFWF